MALKRVRCTRAHHVCNVQHELSLLRMAKSWDRCIGNQGVFWEPWHDGDGAHRGTCYFFAMQCALPPAFPALVLCLVALVYRSQTLELCQVSC